MTEQPTSLLVHDDQPLIGVIVRENGQEVTRYFTNEEEADAAVPSASVQRALSLLGAWRDMDWDEAFDELDHIRHDTQPTPPLEL
jgi:hypothetical protein